MVRALGVMVITGMLLGASSANAQSLGEAVATTGIHQTLAGTGMGNPAGTIGTVKRAVGAAAATKQGQLDGAAGGVGPVGWAAKAAVAGLDRGGRRLEGRRRRGQGLDVGLDRLGRRRQGRRRRLAARRRLGPARAIN